MHRQDPQGRQAGRPADRAADEVRARHQPQDRQGPRPDDPAVPPTAGRSCDRVRLRRRMAHVPLFWVIAVGLVLAVGLVGGGLARMRGQRRHVRAMLRDTFKRRRGQKRSSRDASASGRGGRRLLTRRPAPRGIASGSASQLPVSVCLLRREARQESPAQCDEPGSGLLSVVELLTQPGVGGASMCFGFAGKSTSPVCPPSRWRIRWALLRSRNVSPSRWLL